MQKRLRLERVTYSCQFKLRFGLFGLTKILRGYISLVYMYCFCYFSLTCFCYILVFCYVYFTNSNWHFTLSQLVTFSKSSLMNFLASVKNWKNAIVARYNHILFYSICNIDISFVNLRWGSIKK